MYVYVCNLRGLNLADFADLGKIVKLSKIKSIFFLNKLIQSLFDTKRGIG